MNASVIRKLRHPAAAVVIAAWVVGTPAAVSANVINDWDESR